MRTRHKTCPICEARNHLNAALCATCGAGIADIEAADDPAASASDNYDFRYGETDLAEASLARKGKIGGFILLALLIIGLAALAWLALGPGLQMTESAQPEPTATARLTRMAGPSVTPGPPSATPVPSPTPTATPTPIPTPAPCRSAVQAGESLIAIISRCGHTSLAILPTVMALNGISDETLLRVGMELIVPRPTSEADAAIDTGALDDRSSQLERLAFDPFAPTLTPTLLPGLMWHRVEPDQDMIYIAVSYETNVKVLADLNPEIDFPLCDFGETFGGPECTVQLGVNQRIRVPAPTSTPTPVSLVAGSATPTPRPTATFNAPIAQSPAEAAFFSPNERVTLRWVGTGRLAADELYRVDFANLDEALRYQADTRELFLIIPAEWQSQSSGSHRYSWQVSVMNSRSDARSYLSEPRSFVWQGKGRAEA